MRGADRFVGREQELRALLEALDQSPPHRTNAWMLTGPAGIGKTRLGREFADRARERGWRVVWAHGWAGAGVPSYWPWTQVLRELLDRPATDLAELLGTGTPRMGQFELFDATARRLDEAAGGPLLVVLDDLHVADTDSLHLIRFLVSHGATSPRMILGNWRSVPGEKVDAHALGVTGQVRLEGLTPDETRMVLGSAEHADEIHRLTGGNPLFLDQVATSARASGPGRPTADSLLEATGRRLAGISAEVEEVLLAVTVLGPHATSVRVAELLHRDETVVRAGLRKATVAGLLEEAEPVRLAHPLFGQAAMERADRDRVEELHAVAAELLDADQLPSAVATHLAAAGVHRRPCAVELLLKAAAAATVDFAHDSAVEHLRHADVLLIEPAARDLPVDLRWRVAFELAGAVSRAQGRTAAEPLYAHAEELALREGEPGLVARTIVRHGIEYYTSGEHVRERSDRCREVLDTLPEGEDVLRARLLAQAAVGGMAGVAVEANRRTADEAVAIARRTGDPGAVGAALVAQQVVDLGPDSLPRRIATAREALALAGESGDAELAIHARFLLKAALLEDGRVHELDSELNLQQRHISRVSEARWRRHALWFRCMQAMLDGDPSRVEELAAEIGRLADELADPDGLGVYFGQLGVARWMQGRLVEMEDAYRSQLRDEPESPLWPAVLAWVAVHDGRLDVARGWAERFVAPADVPQGMHTLLTLCTMADVLSTVGDDADVEAVWQALLPYADRTVPLAMGAGLFGPVARFLGTLAVRRGRREEAVALFEEAIAVAGRLGARPWVCEAQVALAEVLVDSGGAADLARVRVLVREAAAIRRTGTVVLEERLAVLEAPIVPTRPVVRIDLLGTFEVTGLDGTVARWSSRKARTLLKMLVAAGGGLVTRDRVLAELWPGTDADLLGNRLAVALTTVRRALDPQRHLASPLVTFSDDGVRLVTEHPEARVLVDAEEFLSAARQVDVAAADRGQVDRVLARVGGLPFAENPYADWAQPLRAEVAVALVRWLGRALELAVAAGDHASVADLAARVLELEPYDEAAHRARVQALWALGAHALADRAWMRFCAARAELGLPGPDELTAPSS